MQQQLEQGLDELRPLLLDTGALVRAVASGRRHVGRPAHVRAELHPVDLKAGRLLQVITTDGRTPRTRNVAPGPDAEAAVDALLAEPFGNWLVETLDTVIQLRVTKKGHAQVHATRTSRRAVEPANHDRVKAHLLDPADPLFTVLGADVDKRRQVDAFLRLLAPVARRAMARARAAGRPLHVVDLGCGNAYLTFAAHRWLAAAGEGGEGGAGGEGGEGGEGGVVEPRTVGVDVRPDLVERNTRLAARLGLDGLSFLAGGISGTDPGLHDVDLVLALHACDTATDEALARAVAWRAPVILAAPCCHHDVQRQLAAVRAGGSLPPHPYEAVTRHPILRERFADVLTDALRASLLRLLGYRAEVVEFVDSRHTPRNALIRAVATGAAPAPQLIGEYAELTSAWRVRPALAELLGPALAAVLAPSGDQQRS